MDGVRYMMRLEAQACATFEAQETSKDDPSLLLSSPPLSSFPPSSSLLFSSPSGLVKLLSMRSLLMSFEAWASRLLIMRDAWASSDDTSLGFWVNEESRPCSMMRDA